MSIIIFKNGNFAEVITHILISSFSLLPTLIWPNFVFSSCASSLLVDHEPCEPTSYFVKLATLFYFYNINVKAIGFCDL